MAGVPVLVPALFAANGAAPASGAKLYAFVKGTSTPQAFYTDDAITTPAANPTIANSLGASVRYLDPSLSYDLVAKTSDEATTLFSVTFNALAQNVVLGAGWDTVLGLPAAGTIDNLSGVRFVATKAAQKTLTAATGLSTGSVYNVLGGTTAGDGYQGEFRYTSSDMSATLVKSTAVVSAVDTTRDMLYSASNTLQTGDGVMATATDAGVTSGSLYYVRVLEQSVRPGGGFVGSTPQNVATAAFTYGITSTIYSKAAVTAGTAIGTAVIPEDKWGGFAFEIGADGTIDLISAANNGTTGYDTEYAALNALASVAASHVRILLFAIMKSNGAFTCGTTALNATGVMARFYEVESTSLLPGWFALHTSWPNARAGTSAVDITALTSLSLKALKDPLQGRYVTVDGAAIDGTAGCFVRTDAGADDPRWYGADATGTNDSAHAHFAAYAINQQVRYPVGRFKWLYSPEYRHSPSATGPSDNKDSISPGIIEGAGSDLTTIYCPANSGVSLVFSSFQHSIRLKGFSITTGTAGGGYKAISLRNTFAFFGTFIAHNHIEDVVSRGDDGYGDTFYWSHDLYAFNVSHLSAEAFFAIGTTLANSANTYGVGIELVGSIAPGTAICTEPGAAQTYNFDHSGIWFKGKGIIQGDNVQGLKLGSGVSILNGFDGIVTPADCLEVRQLQAVGVEISVYGDGIRHETAVSATQISSSYIACGGAGDCIALTTDAGAANGAGISINGCTLTTLDPTGSSRGVYSNVSFTGVVIDGNVFNGLDTGIDLDTGSMNARVGSNEFENSGVDIVDAGTNNTIGVNLASSTEVEGILAIANGGTGNTGGAWTTYTPSLTPAAGSFTSASAAGRWRQIGKIVHIRVAITIVTNGTAGGSIQVSTPVNLATTTVLSGANTTDGVLGYAVGDTATIFLTRYDGTYLGASGKTLVISGSYEAA
jgi:hypothetical protein